MTLYPEVYKRLQEEIDRVVGYGRLPSYSDRPNLPYVEAVLKETLRWETVLPTSLSTLFSDIRFWLTFLGYGASQTYLMLRPRTMYIWAIIYLKELS